MIESCKFTTYSFFLFMGRMKVGQIEYPVVWHLIFSYSEICRKGSIST